jgi:hypothetical protein
MVERTFCAVCSKPGCRVACLARRIADKSEAVSFAGAVYSDDRHTSNFEVTFLKQIVNARPQYFPSNSDRFGRFVRWQPTPKSFN